MNPPDCAHFGEIVDGFESVVDGLSEEGRELTVVEDLQRAPRRDLAHCRRVEPVRVVAVTRLHEYRRVRQTLSVHLTSNVRQADSCNLYRCDSVRDRRCASDAGRRRC
jgi:hypothetical protein